MKKQKQIELVSVCLFLIAFLSLIIAANTFTNRTHFRNILEIEEYVGKLAVQNADMIKDLQDCLYENICPGTISPELVGNITVETWVKKGDGPAVKIIHTASNTTGEWIKQSPRVKYYSDEDFKEGKVPGFVFRDGELYDEITDTHYPILNDENIIKLYNNQSSKFCNTGENKNGKKN